MALTNKKINLKMNFHYARLARVIAKVIDFLIALFVGFLLFPLGIFIGVAYLSFADGLSGGQSLGKRIMGFRVIKLKDNKACSFKRSFVRNLPLSIPFMLFIIPLWGLVLGGLLLLPLAGLELFLIFNLDHLNRLGDVMAETTVTAIDPEVQKSTQANKDWYNTKSLVTFQTYES